MTSQFEKKLADFIKTNGLFDSSDKVLLAVSGGADSTALLYAVSSLRRSNIINPELLCVHINHLLRGEHADADENFVVEQAEKLNIPIIIKQIDVRKFAAAQKLSVETAARQLRIKNLIEIAKENKCTAIATAHQKNDNAETLLQRISRGTGYRGLGGIWPKRIFNNDFTFVRPLLCFDRNQIIAYLQQRNLNWRRDHTNADCTYRRNYIRHRLLPHLQQDCKDSLIEQLSGLSESARKFYETICNHADKLWPNAAHYSDEKVTLEIKLLSTQSQPVLVELLRRSLAAIGCGEKNLIRHHYENIVKLARQNSGCKKIDLPNNCSVRAEHGNLIFDKPEKKSPPEKHIDKNIKLSIPGHTKFGCCSIEAAFVRPDEKEFAKFKAEKNSFVERFDFNKIKPPLIVRFRKVGDRFVPLGLNQEKKIGKFITTARLTQEIRRKLLIVADSEKIIWLWPVRASQQTKVNGQTTKILQLKITNTPVQTE
ncbi:MAG: tRNA lysidine(34) synthetase TilS [Sedimentisphaerales bacterium]|nr:tRNA lysidine(34) synthetase TilS [Sedimentisphaerales bacterium]